MSFVRSSLGFLFVFYVRFFFHMLNFLLCLDDFTLSLNYRIGISFGRIYY